MSVGTEGPFFSWSVSSSPISSQLLARGSQRVAQRDVRRQRSGCPVVSQSVRQVHGYERRSVHPARQRPPEEKGAVCTRQLVFGGLARRVQASSLPVRSVRLRFAGGSAFAEVTESCFSCCLCYGPR